MYGVSLVVFQMHDYAVSTVSWLEFHHKETKKVQLYRLNNR